MRWCFVFGGFRIWFVDQWLGYGDARNRRLAGNNLLTNCFDAFWIEENFHRDALDDLNEVAGGVVRGKQGEIRADARLQTVNPAREPIVRECIDFDFDWLPDP